MLAQVHSWAHKICLFILDILSIHNVDLKREKIRFLTKQINFNPLTPFWWYHRYILWLIGFVSPYTYHSYLYPSDIQKLRKTWCYLNHMNTYSLLIFIFLQTKKSLSQFLISICIWKIKITTIVASKICYPKQTGRLTDRQTSFYEILHLTEVEKIMCRGIIIRISCSATYIIITAIKWVLYTRAQLGHVRKHCRELKHTDYVNKI